MTIQYHAIYKAVVGKYEIRITSQHDGWLLRIADYMSNKPLYIHNSYIKPEEAQQAAKVWIDEQTGEPYARP